MSLQDTHAPALGDVDTGIALQPPRAATRPKARKQPKAPAYIAIPLKGRANVSEEIAKVDPVDWQRVKAVAQEWWLATKAGGVVAPWRPAGHGHVPAKEIAKRQRRRKLYRPPHVLTRVVTEAGPKERVEFRSSDHLDHRRRNLRVVRMRTGIEVDWVSRLR